MNPQNITYSALKTYALVFHVYKWTKRVRMIFFRLVLLGFMVFTAYAVSQDRTYLSYTSDDTISLSFNPLWILFIWFVLKIVLLISMQHSIDSFVKANAGFSLGELSFQAKADPTSPMSRMQVPSFRGKALRVSMSPIVGTLTNGKIGMYARHYKEGGILRWRERQMDTVVWYEVNRHMPHVIVNAKAKEATKLGNMSKRYDASWKFQFEGVKGAAFDAYTKPQDRIPALQLFTPDVLEVLYDSLPNVDVEIKDGTIWFVWRYAVLSDKTAQKMLVGTDAFMAEFTKQLNAMR